MLLEYQLDQIKIVDFLLLAMFWACLLFFSSPSIPPFYFSVPWSLKKNILRVFKTLAQLKKEKIL